MNETPPRGGAIWICGVPATGKSTLARALLDWLATARVATLWLDSDDLRTVLAPEPDYSDAGRDRFYGALAHLAMLGARGGATVVISATAPRLRYRHALRERLPTDRFAEVLLTCQPDTLRAERDAKRLYADADAGRITRLPGVGAPFERDLDAELTLDTTRLGATDVAARARTWLCQHRPQLVAGPGDPS